MLQLNKQVQTAKYIVRRMSHTHGSFERSNFLFCFVLRCCLCFILVYFYAFDSVYFQRVYLRSDGFSSQFKNFLSVKCDRIRIENHCKTSFTGNAETCNQLICICIHQSSCASCLRISVVSTQIDFFQRRLSRSQF